VTTPAPIKILKMKLNDRGEIFLELDATPTEEFMEGFSRYWRKPGTNSSGFNHRVFDRFEGTAIVFKKMPVEEFEENHLGVAKDAVRAANEFTAKTYEERVGQTAALEKAKQSEREELEVERAKAERVNFDQ
jgi:hypothetical protein